MESPFILDFETMPLKLLRHRTVRALCEMLDPEKPNRNDYRVLVSHLKMTYDEFKKLEKEKEMAKGFKSISLCLLRKWSEMDLEKANVHLLFELLKKAERLDAIKEITPHASDDLREAKEDRQNGIFRLDDTQGKLWDGMLMPTVKETLFSSDIFYPGRTFDALISYNPKFEYDRRIMKAIRRDLAMCPIPTEQGGMRVLDIVVGADELIVGSDLTSSLVRAIRYRCKRLIILVSRSFCDSEECVFQMQIAKGLDLSSRNRKVIPVRIEEGAELPGEVSNLNFIDLTNPNQWNREIKRLAISLSISKD